MTLRIGVGPHEGIEFDLMRVGKKDVALFFDYEPDWLHDAITLGFELILFAETLKNDKLAFTRIIYRNGFESAAIRLKYLIQSDAKGFDPEREHEIGAILSYSKCDVDAFLAHVKQARKD